MPEMPDVVASEPVESAWGNDIRDRTVQRYADAAARDASVPIPVAGDTAWLDNPAVLTIHNGTGWIEQVTVLGADFEGPIAVITDPSSGTINHMQITGPTAARFGLNRVNLPTQYRLAVGSPGSLLIQSSPDGTTWTTTATFTAEVLAMGSTGVKLPRAEPQIHDGSDTRRLGLFSTFSVWSQVNSFLRLRVGADGTTSYLMRLYDRAGNEDPIYSFTESGIVGPTATRSDVNYGDELEALQAQVAALQAQVDAL